MEWKTLIDDDLKWADAYFKRRSNVHAAARKLTERLDRLAIPFAFLANYGINGHGYMQTCDEPEVLITEANLARFKTSGLCDGWTEKAPGSRGVRDVENDVPIAFRFAGEARPVAYPDPG